MKYIINGGISTRNVPRYTKDAILLAKKSDILSGVSLNVYPTLDGKVVVYQAPTVDHGKERIADLTLRNLQRRNFGNRIRRFSILQLTEVMELFKNTEKLLILNLDGREHSEEFLKNILAITNEYPNTDIYIKTEDEISLNYLQEHAKKERIGPVITEDNRNLWNLDFDFYSVGTKEIESTLIRKKIEENKRIMFEDVDTVKRYQKIYQELKDVSQYIYIITNVASNLAAIFLIAENSH